MSKILVVLGATGNQGGSVITSMLGDPTTKAEWKLRAVTRDPTSAKAQKLTAQGVECVAANVDDKASLEQAFKGAYAVFGVTDFWIKMSKDVEVQQGKNIADAAKSQGVKHLVWSSLINVTKVTNGKLNYVTHFDSKAEVEEYIRAQNIPATFVMPGCYMSNFPGNMMREHQPGGPLVLALPNPPTAQMPMLDAAADPGKWVKAVLKRGNSMLGKNIIQATEYLTMQQVVDTVKKETGKDAIYMQVPADAFEKVLTDTGMPQHAAHDLTGNMLLMTDPGYYAGAKLDESLAILEEAPTTWAQYAKNAPAWQ